MGVPRRQPTGPEHDRLIPHTWYRTPLYEKSHFYIEGDEALCGRLLLIDEMWWVDSGWEEFTCLPPYLVEDIRKGDGRCADCKAKLNDTSKQGVVWQRPPDPAPWDDDSKRALTVQHKAELLRRRSMAAFVAREFGGEVVDNDMDMLDDRRRAGRDRGRVPAGHAADVPSVRSDDGGLR